MKILIFTIYSFFFITQSFALEGVSVRKNNGEQITLKLTGVGDSHRAYTYQIIYPDSTKSEPLAVVAEEGIEFSFQTPMSGKYSLEIYKLSGPEAEEIVRLHSEKSASPLERIKEFFGPGRNEDQHNEKKTLLGKASQYGGTVKNTVTGVYHKIPKLERLISLWKQDFFVISKSDHDVQQNIVSKLAQTYAPIVLLHEDEAYIPSSLEYILNQEDVDPELAQEMFSIKRGFTSFEIDFPYSDINKILRSMGDSSAVLKVASNSKLSSRTGNRNNITIYYSHFENSENLFLHYHFLYAYDPKTGDPMNPSIAGHGFDRESFTLVFDKESLTPIKAAYGAHLADQVMALLDAETGDIQKWKGGRVVIDWDSTDIFKYKDRPVLSIAKGSHAIYPFPGVYSVKLTGVVDILVEAAGGNQVLVPTQFTAQESNGNYSIDKYNLKNLELNNINADRWNGALSFSGNFVDVLGLSNARFPPFTSREFAVEDYVFSPEAYIWDSSKNPKTLKANRFRFELLLEKIY